MAECERCLTEKSTKKVDGIEVTLCLHMGCLFDRMLEEYQGCSHDLQQKGSFLLECSNCGMNATPSYQQNS